jgi:DNA-binding SARP family transcriptional activator
VIRALNRLATSTIAVLIVVGPPAVAVVWAAHQPWRQLRIGDVRGWVANPPDEAVIWLLVATGAAVLWLLTTLLILRAAARPAVRTWRRLRHLPLPTPAQATAGSLAGTALLGLPAVTATHADTPTAPPAASSSEPHHDPARPPIDDSNADPEHGVDLPDGGWVPHHTAEDVAAMAGLFWLRRRQTYQPTQSHAAPPVLPATATVVAAACPPGAAVAHTAAAPTSADQLPPGDLTLTGSGARAAARGLLVTALMANTAIERPRVHIVITAPDLDLLLAGTGSALPEIPGLHITGHPDTLLPQLTATTAAGDPAGAATPARVVHLTSQGAERLSPRRETVGALTTLTFAGDAPAGRRAWHVGDDGTLTASTSSGRRLCVLGEQATLDLLLLISQAHGLTPASTHSHPDATSGDPTTAAEPATTSVPPARLQVLGDCRLTAHGCPVPVRRSAAWQILVWLAAHPAGGTARQLIETVWPGLPAGSITHRLYTTLHDLRAQLTAVLDQPLIVRRGERYALDPTAVHVDLWQLRTAADRAAAATSTADRHDAHAAVLRQYGGDLAAGHDWGWLAGLRETVRNQVIDAYADLTEHLPADEALARLREAITVDPYNERLHHRTITALIDLGNHTAAARLHDAYLDRLRQAGLQPGSSIIQLEPHLSPRARVTSPATKNPSTSHTSFHAK